MEQPTVKQKSLNTTMEIRELLEGGHADIAAHGQASRLASAIGRWMSQKNADRPLNQIMTQRSLGGERMGFVASCKYMGMDVDDLVFGFGYYPYSRDVAAKMDSASAFMATGKRADGSTLYYVIMMVDEYPGDKTDLMYSVKWDELIHELTHYIDRKRSQTVRKAPRGESTEYYNDPMEFNAYFQQGLYSMMAELGHFPKSVRPEAISARVETFPAFLRSYEASFSSDWRYHMLPETRRRFLKRMFNLWTAIKDGWPDTASVIRAAIHEEP